MSLASGRSRGGWKKSEYKSFSTSMAASWNQVLHPGGFLVVSCGCDTCRTIYTTERGGPITAFEKQMLGIEELRVHRFLGEYGKVGGVGDKLSHVVYAKLRDASTTHLTLSHSHTLVHPGIIFRGQMELCRLGRRNSFQRMSFRW